MHTVSKSLGWKEGRICILPFIFTVFSSRHDEFSEELSVFLDSPVHTDRRALVEDEFV
jgi:hypothetical protein